MVLARNGPQARLKQKLSNHGSGQRSLSTDPSGRHGKTPAAHAAGGSAWARVFLFRLREYPNRHRSLYVTCSVCKAACSQDTDSIKTARWKCGRKHQQCNHCSAPQHAGVTTPLPEGLRETQDGRHCPLLGTRLAHRCWRTKGQLGYLDGPQALAAPRSRRS